MESISRIWLTAAPYLSQFCLGTLAFLALLKDWRDYGKLSSKFGKHVPLGLAIITAVIMILGIQEVHESRVSADHGKQQAQADKLANQAVINQLSGQVQQLRDDNHKDTDSFRVSFGALYNKFSDLQSKVQNAELMNELDETKLQLRETQKKLSQPKAAPVATFSTRDDSKIPVTETTLERTGETVTIELQLYNPSDVPALNGAAVVRICIDCKYASEPAQFKTVKGANDSDREYDFQHIFAGTRTETLTLKVDVSHPLQRFNIAVYLSCDTCVRPTPQILFVNLKQD